MAAALSPMDIKADGLQPLSGIVTNYAISKEWGVTAGGSRGLRIDVKLSAVTVVGSIAVKLQHRSPGTSSYSTVASTNGTASVSADGVVSLTMLDTRSADQADLPLKSMIRVVLTTTNAGDAVTVDNVWIQQPL